MPTGLFALGNYGHLDSDLTFGTSETWYVKGGLRQRFSSLGNTVFYGEWLENKADGFWPAAVGATDAKLQVWGVGVVQEIDAAAMSVWLKYRNQSYEDNTVNNYQDFQYVGFGGLINF